LAFIFKIENITLHNYIAKYIENLASLKGIDITLIETDEKIELIADENDPNLSEFLKYMGDNLPASIFMGSSNYEIKEIDVKEKIEQKSESLPLSIALCPICQKEIFDPKSSRYYYPFTSCSCCGAQYGLVDRYPFTRENTQLRFFAPCEKCNDELKNNPFRKGYQLISCHNCGVPVKMKDGSRERYANDPGSFKKMFEVASKAILDGKTIRIKTLMGYRLFFDAKIDKEFSDRRLMILNASKIGSYCAVIQDEINALLAIERPTLDVTLSDESLWPHYGHVARIKYPDDGFSILLAKELIENGVGYVGYFDCDKDEVADFVIDYDLEINTQSDIHYFINKESKFIVEGERVSFPARYKYTSDRVTIAHGLAAVPENSNILIERVEKLESVEASELYMLEGEEIEVFHSKTVHFDQPSASVMSVMLEHNITNSKTVGIYFDNVPIFLYHNGKKPIIAVPSLEFKPDELRENIATLREGSDRLVKNFEKKYPERAKELFSKDAPADLFRAAAVIMGLDNPSFRAVSKVALNFVGKGGLQVDTKVSDNRFDPFAFLASIISYQMAEAPSTLLSYSIFESFGDYISEVANELKRRSKADNIVLCGRAFGNQSLFSRIQRNFSNEKIYMNRFFPIGKENTVVGGIAL